MSDPTPAALEYQTPQAREPRWWSKPGVLALACALLQVPWVILCIYLSFMFRMGRPKDFLIDTSFEALLLLPSFVAVVLAIRAAVQRNASPAQRLFALIAIAVAGVFFWWQIPFWWADILHASPGEVWPYL